MKYKVSWMSEKAILKSGRRVVGVFKNVEKCGKMGKNSCPRIRNTILLTVIHIIFTRIDAIIQYFRCNQFP